VKHRNDNGEKCETLANYNFPDQKKDYIAQLIKKMEWFIYRIQNVFIRMDVRLDPVIIMK